MEKKKYEGYAIVFNVLMEVSPYTCAYALSVCRSQLTSVVMGDRLRAIVKEESSVDRGGLIGLCISATTSCLVVCENHKYHYDHYEIGELHRVILYKPCSLDPRKVDGLYWMFSLQSQCHVCPVESPFLFAIL